MPTYEYSVRIEDIDLTFTELRACARRQGSLNRSTVVEYQVISSNMPVKTKSLPSNRQPSFRELIDLGMGATSLTTAFPFKLASYLEDFIKQEYPEIKSISIKSLDNIPLYKGKVSDNYGNTTEILSLGTPGSGTNRRTLPAGDYSYICSDGQFSEQELMTFEAGGRERVKAVHDMLFGFQVGEVFSLAQVRTWAASNNLHPDTATFAVEELEYQGFIERINRTEYLIVKKS